MWRQRSGEIIEQFWGAECSASFRILQTWRCDLHLCPTPLTASVTWSTDCARCLLPLTRRTLTPPCLSSLLLLLSLSQEAELSFVEVASLSRPGANIPVNVTFSPDSSHVSYLYSAGTDLVRDLYSFTVDGKSSVMIQPPSVNHSEDELTLEEKLRRERSRQVGHGITDYSWAARTARVVLPLPTGVFVSDVSG